MSEKPKSAPGTGSPLLPAALSAPVCAAVDSPLLNTKGGIASQELLLLREFFYFWTNGTANNRGEGGEQHNVMESRFRRETIPLSSVQYGLRLKISRKEKPYCMCLDCGIQIFFRGQAGIQRLHEMIAAEVAVVHPQ